MASTSSVVLILAATLAAAGFTAFAVASIREAETRAARISLLVAVVASIPLVLAVWLPAPYRTGIVCALAAALALGVVLFLLPVGRIPRGNGHPSRRVDERDIPFARARLRPGTPEFERYYEMRPENREVDDRFRALPGLLSPSAPLAEPVAFASAQASFAVTEALRDQVDGPVGDHRLAASPAELTDLVKRLALRLGALAAGVTELRPYHVYSHIGRGSGTWGAPIPLEHRFAVAFTVEMDHRTMRSAPRAPVVAESARQYVESARVAIQLAAALRGLGYPARAHIDGNYRVIVPLVGRDAGLGEIGRMGLLMTPRIGPRVRAAVVTTTAELVPDPPTDDRAVIDFCRICRKCAVNCPAAAIPEGDREPVDEGLRWRLDADACFRYWNAIGTDCGRCLAVCPFSHPDSLAHTPIRWAVRRSGVARRLLSQMDDLFYGSRPGPASPPVRSGR